MRTRVAALLVLMGCGSSLEPGGDAGHAPGDTDGGAMEDARGDASEPAAVLDSGLTADGGMAERDSSVTAGDAGQPFEADAGPLLGGDAGESADGSVAPACVEPHGIWAKVAIDGVSWPKPGATFIMAVDTDVDFSPPIGSRSFDAATCRLHMMRTTVSGPDVNGDSSAHTESYLLVVGAESITGSYRSAWRTGTVDGSDTTQQIVLVPAPNAACHPSYCDATADWPTRP